MDKVRRHAKRVLIGIVGGIVVTVGIIAIPYPGPGWLIVFAGLAILATEFDWARRLLDLARRHYDNWLAWVERQTLVVRMAIILATSIVVVTTLWLVNAFGLIDTWLDLPFDWLQSPLF